LTPLRDLVIAAKRNDPQDLGTYAWAEPGRGLKVRFWDNGRFSDWVKRLWAGTNRPSQIRLVKDGRFLGIELDLMDTPRQDEPFYAEADRIWNLSRRVNVRTLDLTSCKKVFALGLQ